LDKDERKIPENTYILPIRTATVKSLNFNPEKTLIDFEGQDCEEIMVLTIPQSLWKDLELKVGDECKLTISVKYPSRRIYLDLPVEKIPYEKFSVRVLLLRSPFVRFIASMEKWNLKEKHISFGKVVA